MDSTKVDPILYNYEELRRYNRLSTYNIRKARHPVMATGLPPRLPRPKVTEATKRVVESRRTQVKSGGARVRKTTAGRITSMSRGQTGVHAECNKPWKVGCSGFVSGSSWMDHEVIYGKRVPSKGINELLAASNSWFSQPKNFNLDTTIERKPLAKDKMDPIQTTSAVSKSGPRFARTGSHTQKKSLHVLQRRRNPSRGRSKTARSQTREARRLCCNVSREIPASAPNRSRTVHGPQLAKHTAKFNDNTFRPSVRTQDCISAQCSDIDETDSLSDKQPKQVAVQAHPATCISISSILQHKTGLYITEPDAKNYRSPMERYDKYALSGNVPQICENYAKDMSDSSITDLESGSSTPSKVTLAVDEVGWCMDEPRRIFLPFQSDLPPQVSRTPTPTAYGPPSRPHSGYGMYEQNVREEHNRDSRICSDSDKTSCISEQSTQEVPPLDVGEPELLVAQEASVELSLLPCVIPQVLPRLGPTYMPQFDYNEIVGRLEEVSRERLRETNPSIWEEVDHAVRWKPTFVSSVVSCTFMRAAMLTERYVKRFKASHHLLASSMHLTRPLKHAGCPKSYKPYSKKHGHRELKVSECFYINLTLKRMSKRLCSISEIGHDAFGLAWESPKHAKDNPYPTAIYQDDEGEWQVHTPFENALYRVPDVIWTYRSPLPSAKICNSSDVGDSTEWSSFASRGTLTTCEKKRMCSLSRRIRKLRSKLPRLALHFSRRKRKHSQLAQRSGMPRSYKCFDKSSLIHYAMQCLGWRRVHAKHDEWNMVWGPFSSVKELFKNHLFLKDQYIPHFPNNQELLEMHLLQKNISCYQAVMKQIGFGNGDLERFNFVPLTFKLPQEYERFQQYLNEHGDDGTWILKPLLGMKKGTTIFRSLEVLALHYKYLRGLIDGTMTGPRYSRKQSCLIQQYIDDPYLLHGQKFVIRMYVLVESFRPLKVWIYREGYSKITSEKYELSQECHARFTRRNFARLSGMMKHGIPLSFIRRGLAKQLPPRKVELIFQMIKSVILNTLLSVDPVIRPSKHSFGFYGFDMMIDSSLKPWLLKVTGVPVLPVPDKSIEVIHKNLVEDVLTVLNYDKRYELNDNISWVGRFDLLWNDGPVCISLSEDIVEDVQDGRRYVHPTNFGAEDEDRLIQLACLNTQLWQEG